MGKHQNAARQQQDAAVLRKPRDIKKCNAPAFGQSETMPAGSGAAPLFFFKEDQENGWLCQWYRCCFSDPTNTDVGNFNSIEQWMMYQKAKEFKDLAVAREIMNCTSPRKQKGLARDVSNFDEARWTEVRSKVVEDGSYLKFTQCTNVASMKMDDVGDPVPLRQLLLATGNRELVEASPYDRVWGIGFTAEEASGVPRSKWGENLLGKALMRVRDRLNCEAEDNALLAVA